MMGSVDFMLMGALLVGSIPGIIVGSLLGSRASDKLSCARSSRRPCWSSAVRLLAGA